MTPDKVYVVVDKALSSGAKIAQAGHALAGLVMEGGPAVKEWAENSNVLIVLEAEAAGMELLHVQLQNWAFVSGCYELGPVAFREPDFGGRMTAFAIVNGSPFVNVALSGLRLAQSSPGGKFSEWRKRNKEASIRKLHRS